MSAKPIMASRTVRFNLVLAVVVTVTTAILEIAGTHEVETFLTLFSEDTRILFAAAVNIIAALNVALRLVTREPVAFGGGKGEGDAE